jgi:predicted enzyme related to lactoylglutathione lyase
MWISGLGTARTYEPGTPSWVDLGTPDVDGAAAFYGELFGGTAQSSPHGATFTVMSRAHEH